MTQDPHVEKQVDGAVLAADQPLASQSKSDPASHVAPTITELGCAGHLIVSQSCRWRRHTQIGTRYRVSTIGDYYYRDKCETIGASPDSFFETMVFETTDRPEPESEGCGCLAVVSFSEIDGTRYATAGEAQEGHERFVRTYVAKAEGK